MPNYFLDTSKQGSTDLLYRSAAIRLSHLKGLSAPVLRAVPDVEDFGNVIFEAVDDDVGRAVQFAGSFDILAGAAEAGKMLQVLDTAKNRPGNLAGGLRVVL